jgi:hypothetical protein
MTDDATYARMQEIERSRPAIQMAAATQACLHQLIALLIAKGVPCLSG